VPRRDEAECAERDGEPGGMAHVEGWDRGGGDAETRHCGIVIARANDELRVGVNDVEADARVEQALRDHDVVENLRVASEHVAVALGGRQGFDQGLQARTLHDGERRRDLEVVQIADDRAELVNTNKASEVASSRAPVRE
jgi:hypothetical protein